jgi:hypothetical protein
MESQPTSPMHQTTGLDTIQGMGEGELGHEWRIGGSL